MPNKDDETQNESSQFQLESEAEAGDSDFENQLNAFGCTCKATALIVDDNPFNLIPLKMNLLDKHKIVCIEGEDGV